MLISKSVSGGTAGRMMRFSLKRFCMYGALGCFILFILSKILCRDLTGSWSSGPRMIANQPVQYMTDSHNNSYPYDRNMPLIFIGGMPRSGTTLMRAILDAHPDVRCGEETRVIPRLLGLKTQWQRSEKESKRLIEAGISDEVLNAAISAFILEVVAKHAEPAPRLCNKDPFTLKSTLDLIKMFPNAQFLLMIRDGRAVVHSIISRGVTISGFDLKDFKGCLQKWNTAVENMYLQCHKAGPSRCLPVYYEELVLHPEPVVRRILEFLDIRWDDVVLHHDDQINKPGGVSLSKIERSTDQVIKPINLEALTAWASHVPEDVKTNIRTIAPMLERLGYDPDAYPPNYGQADKLVQDNTFKVRNNVNFWKEKAAIVQNIGKSAANQSAENEKESLTGDYSEVKQNTLKKKRRPRDELSEENLSPKVDGIQNQRR